ncbi:hypothetical protein E2C01_058577 [Portunus trituberculatus]|uniref:Uncharacterized protein n=1 Tax=Portunus trituberculatus TaxID=210409 RepID=A0A5B7GVY6_PORTR|nr:hypothetical protein [Portunus trituberculatus]
MYTGHPSAGYTKATLPHCYTAALHSLTRLGSDLSYLLLSQRQAVSHFVPKHPLMNLSSSFASLFSASLLFLIHLPHCLVVTLSFSSSTYASASSSTDDSCNRLKVRFLFTIFSVILTPSVP